MKSFILAIQFLTRLPINRSIEVKEDSFAKSVIYFPVAGLIVGAIGALTYAAARYIFNGMFPIICALLANICVTGALHLDGLADTCDGIFSARKRDRMLEIMKDSRIGTNGAIAIAFDLLFRAAILVNMPEKAVFFALLLAPLASKAVLPLIMKVSVYARAEGGLGQLFIGRQTWGRTLGSLAIGAVFNYIGIGMLGLLVLTATVAIGLLLRLYIYSKLQGMTGDTLGAASEVMEIAYLLFFAYFWRYFIL